MKGFANIVAIILILVIIVGSVSAFFLWGMLSTRFMENAAENKMENTGRVNDANFKISDIKIDTTNSIVNITIENNGKVDLNTKDFVIYLNNTRYELQSYGTQNVLKPGETITNYISCSGGLQKYDIKVSGPLGTSDEIYSIELPC